MTDRTHPDSGRIITSSDILLHDAKTALMYEELRAAIDDGHESMTHADALAEIAAIRSENEQLQAQLASIRAGGVSGPLMCQPQEMPDLSALTERGAKAWAGVDAQGLREGVACAGSEPVAQAKGVFEFWWADHMPNATQEEAWREWCELMRPGPVAVTHPSPPEGMVEGWMPIETAPKYTEHGVSQHLLLGYAPDEIHEDGFVSQGYWMEAEEDAPDNMGHDGGWVDVHFDFFRCGRSFGAEAYRSAGTQPTHWMHLPPPPTSSADSSKEQP